MLMTEIRSVLAAMPDGRLERILRDLPTGASTRSCTSCAATTERRTHETRTQRSPLPPSQVRNHSAGLGMLVA